MRLALCLVTVCAAAPLAVAEQAAAGLVRYEAAWYGKFAPQTALDMINRTPGFTLDAHGSTRRGLSGGVGNVLIDGERPTAKSQAITDILQRIPATQVSHIELLRGAELAGDASGASVLANIVRLPAKAAGTWSAGVARAPGGKFAPNGSLSWSGRNGATDYSVGASTRTSDRNLPGTRQVADTSGNVLAWREDESPREHFDRTLNADLSRAISQGRIALSGKLAHSRYRELSTLTTVSSAGDRLEDEIYPYDGSTQGYESAVNFSRTIGPWELELAALTNRWHSKIDAGSTHRDAALVVDAATTQQLSRDRGESVAQFNLARSFDGHRLEAGLEGALNTLEARTSQWQDLGEGWSVVELPNANLQVREERQEAFAGYAWNARGEWSMEARLTAEASRLELSGDAERSVELVYWKPSLQVARGFGAGNQWQFRVFRDVGQLDFNNFASAPSLADDVFNGGNPSLRPETSWRAEIAADLRFGAGSALSLKGFHYRLSDAVDLVPVGDASAGTIAPANIGEGTITGIDLNCNLSVGEILPGGVLQLGATVQESEVEDPVTIAARAISGFQPSRFRAALRQDVANLRFAWGVSYYQQDATRSFRPAEVDMSRSGPSLDVYLETHALDAIKVRLSAYSILGAANQRERTFYSPDRTGDITSIETSQRQPGSWWALSLSGNF